MDNVCLTLYLYYITLKKNPEHLYMELHCHIVFLKEERH